MRRDDDDADTFVIWADNALLLLGGFILITFLLIQTIVVKTQEVKSEGIEAPGNLIVEVRWKDGIDADVDLWLLAPSDAPVGYSNQSGHVFNLLRDDLGNLGDLGALNYENAYTRGIPPGEYIVNLHAYRGDAALYPINVDVIVSIKKDPKSGQKGTDKIITTKATLYRTTEEVTAVRFLIDANMALVAGSENHLLKKVRGK